MSYTLITNQSNWENLCVNQCPVCQSALVSVKKLWKGAKQEQDYLSCVNCVFIIRKDKAEFIAANLRSGETGYIKRTSSGKLKLRNFKEQGLF